MVIETLIKNMHADLKKEITELRKLIVGKNLVGNWVKQPIACAMLNVKPRRLRDVRIHLDANNNKVGVIRWRKGAGKTVEYYKPDLEKYLSKITIQ
jgi:hypothetical protein